MPTLNTGLVRVAGYAPKVRRTLLAQLKQAIAAGEVSPREVVYKAAQLNRLLYISLVEELRLQKNDVVRVRVDYELSDGELKWNLNTARIEVWRADEALSAKAVETLKAVAEREKWWGQRLTARLVASSPLGEEVYELVRGDTRVGAVKVVKMDDTAVVIGAILDPPVKIKATVKTVEDVVAVAESVASTEAPVAREEAEKIVEALLRS